MPCPFDVSTINSSAKTPESGAGDSGQNSGGNEQERGDGKQLGGDLGNGEEGRGFVDVEDDATSEEQGRNGGRGYSENAVEIISDDDALMEEKTKNGIDTIVICSDSEHDDGMREKATLQKTDIIPVPWLTVCRHNQVEGVCKKCNPELDDSDSSVCDSPLPAPKRSRVLLLGSSDKSLVRGTPLKTKDSSEDVSGSASSTSTAAAVASPSAAALGATYGGSEDFRVSAFASSTTAAVAGPSAAAPQKRQKKGAAAGKPAGIDKSDLKARFNKRAATSTAAAAEDTLLTSSHISTYRGSEDVHV